MLLRRFTLFVLEKRFNAILAIFISALMPVFEALSIPLAALVTLRKGSLEGTFAFIAAIIPKAMIYWWSPPAGPVILDVIYIYVLSSFLTWLMVVLLRNYGSWGFTFEVVALLLVVTIILLHMVYPTIDLWWADQLKSYFKFIRPVFDQMDMRDYMVREQTKVILFAKNYATGIMVVFIFLHAMTQSLLARWWQSIIFNPGGLKSELHQIRLSQKSALFFSMALVGAFVFQVDTIKDMMPILFLIFGIAGLSLTHHFLSLTHYSGFWLIACYILLFLGMPFSMILISLVAWLDSGLHFRKRFG